MNIFERLSRAKQNLSGLSLFIFLFSSPHRMLKHFLDNRAITRVDSLRDRFTVIYDRNVWGSKESISGSGSSLAMTEIIRSELPIVFQKFGIKSIFDGPCGDFNLMRCVDLNGILYTGGDIVAPLIEKLQKEFASEKILFVQMDITKDLIPKSDLVLNRDCLFHLSYCDILSFLEKYIESESKYLLSTSYENSISFKNSNIRSGGFRLIDLFTSPFNFSKNFHYQISEQGEGSLPPRSLYLWDRNQVRVAHSNLEKYLSGL